ncbi:MAG: ActS/PrrB/RegB family redox-sensitive histidine kinase [Pseudomonadota bacterium]
MDLSSDSADPSNTNLPPPQFAAEDVNGVVPRKRSLAGGALRLDTIIKLRWGAVAGQSLAVFVAGYVFGLSAHLVLCFLLIGAAAWLNIFLLSRFARTSRLPENPAFSLFVFDLVQLSGLLFLTGGLTNPFALLVIAPVVTSSSILSLRRTAELGAIAVALITFLAFAHLPLPWTADAPFQVPSTYILGVWVALTVSILFTTFYVYRVGREARILNDALSATEMVLQREVHLQALDGVAAAAAHELGTPLATISLTAKELDRAASSNDPAKEDLQLIVSQAARCRDILKRLNNLGGDGSEHFPVMTPVTMVEHVLEPLREAEPDVEIRFSVSEGSEPGSMPQAARNPGVLHGLANIVENALDFAESSVEVEVEWNDEEVSVVVSDDGPGFSIENLESFGEPNMSRRPSALDGTPKAQRAGGLGLGLFIAKTLLERSGGRVEAANRPSVSDADHEKRLYATQHLAKGAIVEVRWPRSAFEGSDGELVSNWAVRRPAYHQDM